MIATLRAQLQKRDRGHCLGGWMWLFFAVQSNRGASIRSEQAIGIVVRMRRVLLVFLLDSNRQHI